MVASPVTSNTDLISFTIQVEGNAINDIYPVYSIYISNSVNKIPYCEIELLDGDPATEDFPVSDGTTFIPGNTIEVLAGYGNDNQTVFKGIIVKHAVRVKDQAGTTLSVLCKDESVKMTRGRKNASYQNTKDSDIISGLLSHHDLQGDVSSTSISLKEVIQYYVSDWDFMLSRADTNGLLVIVNNGIVRVKSPDDASNPVLSLTYGLDILEFDGEIDAETQFKTVTSTAWDMKEQKLITNSQSLSNFPAGDLTGNKLADVLPLTSFNLQTSGFLESDMLAIWSKAQAIKSKYAKLKGSVSFQGSATIAPGMLIELNGVGKHFNGNNFVSGITHDISNGNWVTTAEFGLSTEWFLASVKTEAPLASALSPGIQGLQIGKVKQINSDPNEEFRVLIDLPLLGSDSKGVWARLGSFYASSGTGSFFYPETGDEVVVGFFNNDPNYPVILASLYSSARSAPYTPDEKNNTKAWVTREKMKIVFDEEKKIITILTPSNNTLVLNDDAKSISMTDQHNNLIKMSAAGIEINSASNITIKARQEINVESGTNTSVKASAGNLSLQAAQNLSAKGMNVSCNGALSFKAQGGGSAELSASGEVKVQGARVMIN